jgi:hypothetical protein
MELSDIKAIARTIRDALRSLPLIILVTALAACATLPPAPKDLLDDHTGVTTTVVGAPIEFGGQFTHSAHDFLTLVATQQDNDGKYTTLLLLYRWSAYYDPAAAPGSGILSINIDGNSIDLQPLERLPPGLPTPEDLFVPDRKEPALRAYVTDLDTLKRIAMSHDLIVQVSSESAQDPYSISKDGRPALEQFVKHLSSP